MGDINSFALQQAEAAAAKLWAFGTAPFPLSLAARLIQRHVDRWSPIPQLTLQFMFGAFWITRHSHQIRRSMQSFGVGFQHRLTKVAISGTLLNRIVHATEFEVGFVRLPDNARRLRGRQLRSHLSADQDGST